ncbi:MAG: SusD/RagB family nutrient-binding outer membrane lipoprotein [Bacteroidota bacterium]
MYIHLRSIGLLLILLLFTLTSCDKKFEELNENPNQPTTTNPDFLWTEAAVIGAGQFSTGVNTEIWTLMEWTMMMGDINGYPTGGDPYAYSGDWNDQLWQEWYTRLLAPVNEIIRLTEGDAFLINKHSIARIWRAWAFSRITDLWGDVPYFEALRGVNPDGDPILTPVYDGQDVIYAAEFSRGRWTWSRARVHNCRRSGRRV